MPDSPSSGLDTSSFLAPSQPAQVPRPALGTLSSRSAAVAAVDAAPASDDVSVVAESDSEGEEEEEEKPNLLEQHSIRSADGDDESKDDTVMVSRAEQATRPDSQRWTDSALLGAATQGVGDSMTDSALLEAETQEKGCNGSGCLRYLFLVSVSKRVLHFPNWGAKH